MENDTQISDGQKWKLRELFTEFFNSISLSKIHLESIEHNTREEIHIIFDKFKSSINKRHDAREDELEKKIEQLENEVNQRIKELEKELQPIKFWVNSVKWFFGIVLVALLTGLVGVVSKKL